MEPNATQPDHRLDALADSLVQRIWCHAILPGIGLQLAILLAFSFSFALTSRLRADDDNDDDKPTPAVVVADLPDDGQPPAPSSEPAPAENTSTSTESTSAAEVVTDAQVEQIAEQSKAAEATEATQVRELSVEPVLEMRSVLPPDRPAWVGAPNDTSERVHRLYVASFTTENRDLVEREEMLDEPLVAALQRYLSDSVFPGQGALRLPITAEFIRANLLDDSTSYVAAMKTQTGTVYQKWVILKVTPEHREHFAGQLREHKQRERMAVLGVGLVGVLGLTGLANFGFNRRRRRYPNAITPVTMAIMPTDGQGNAVQVAAGASPPVVHNAPRKKHSFLVKSLIMLMAIGLVLVVLLTPAVLIKRRAIQTEHTRININGQVWEVETSRPLMEALSDHH